MRRTATILLSLCASVSTLLIASPTQADTKLPVSYNFLLSAVSGGGELTGTAPGANNWSCKPTATHPLPVVLVHGTLGNGSTNWQTYGPLLANEGYCVYSFTYGAPASLPPIFGGLGPMEASAAQLASFVTKVRTATGAAKVDLVGHSQGTLMPNYYAKFLGGARYINAYVSLAPVWHGTALASVLPLLSTVFGVPEGGFPVCGACAQFATGSAFMARMREGGVAVPGVKYTNIMTNHDELVVPYTSGREAGMTNIVVQDKCGIDLSEHFEIAADPVAAAYVLNALDPAHPRPIPCTLVLPFTGPLA
ncbi:MULTISPECIES: esterase/lipase family protein [unclassified Nocardioides]|uniref:esterase/lipase family protein n=1 Tax=unclassified Nocardioides TaxID=2615069 RepID=UPI0006F94D2D|nr:MULTISPECIES: alpha/beta fold hydrolase [unclassified Nocardioides]KRA29390.1 lipase [Nocardioides sp. Root614]KRA85582.1 lipase [Nocardioides sp. Root682]